MSYSKPVALLVAAVLGLVGMSSMLGARETDPARFGGTDSVGDTLWSFRAPARWPSGLAWDGTDLWMTDIEEDSLYRLSMEGTVLGALALPESVNSPAGMTFINGELWMVDENTARLHVMDTATMLPRRSLILPDTTHPDPTSTGLAWDGTHLWHMQYAHWARIFEIDTVDGSIVSSFAPPDSWMYGIEYDGQYLWAASNRTNTAYVMSLPSGTVVQTYNWKVPYSLDMTFVNGYMWVASGKTPSGTRRIYKVDIDQGGLAEKPGTSPARRLSGAVPNPFRARTRISPGPGSPAIVEARAFDAQGRLVRRLDADCGAVAWDGIDQNGGRTPAGAYVIRVRFADNSTEQHPVLLGR